MAITALTGKQRSRAVPTATAACGGASGGSDGRRNSCTDCRRNGWSDDRGGAGDGGGAAGLRVCVCVRVCVCACVRACVRVCVCVPDTVVL